MRGDGENPQQSVPLWRKLVFGKGKYLFLRNFLLTVVVVTAVAILLFGVSGVWPPMVAVESGSMEPTLERGDLVFVVDTGRFDRPGSNNQGIVTTQRAAEKELEARYGSVVLYTVPGKTGSPVIHRAAIEVDRGENWYTDADPSAINAESCSELQHCPARYAGYITKGDNNQLYDQANGVAPVVKDSWVKGVAKKQVPYVGQVRLWILRLAKAV